MTRCSVSKVVTSYGSTWGRIRPQGDSREIFFNSASIDGTVDFSSIQIGQDVEFDECADHVNGTRAERVTFSGLVVARDTRRES